MGDYFFILHFKLRINNWFLTLLYSAISTKRKSKLMQQETEDKDIYRAQQRARKEHR